MCGDEIVAGSEVCDNDIGCCTADCLGFDAAWDAKG